MTTLSRRENRNALMTASRWFLNYADGKHDLLQIAQQSGMDPLLITNVAKQCELVGLVARSSSDLTHPPQLT